MKESITDVTIKNAALRFLKKKTFHQTLRNEILFAISPRTLESGEAQRNGVLSVMKSLLFGGFLRDQGLKQLGTMIELVKIIGHDWIFTFESSPIDAFCVSGHFLYIINIIYNSPIKVFTTGPFCLSAITPKVSMRWC